MLPSSSLQASSGYVCGELRYALMAFGTAFPSSLCSTPDWMEPRGGVWTSLRRTNYYSSFNCATWSGTCLCGTAHARLSWLSHGTIRVTHLSLNRGPCDLIAAVARSKTILHPVGLALSARSLFAIGDLHSLERATVTFSARPPADPTAVHHWQPQWPTSVSLADADTTILVAESYQESQDSQGESDEKEGKDDYPPSLSASSVALLPRARQASVGQW